MPRLLEEARVCPVCPFIASSVIRLNPPGSLVTSHGASSGLARIGSDLNPLFPLPPLFSPLLPSSAAPPRFAYGLRATCVDHRHIAIYFASLAMSVNRSTRNIPHCRCNWADLHRGVSPSERRRRRRRRRNARGISLGRNQGVDEGSAPRTMQRAPTRSWCSRGLFIRFIPARPRSVRVCDCFCEKLCHALETCLPKWRRALPAECRTTSRSRDIGNIYACVFRVFKQM